MQTTAHRRGITHLTLAIAGIFGANPMQIPKIKIGQMGENNSSSVHGGAPHPANHGFARLPGSQGMCRVAIAGIFAEPGAVMPTPRTSQLTNSSVEGGIFADAARRSSPDMRPKTGIRHTVTEEDAVAGKKLERDSHAAAEARAAARGPPPPTTTAASCGDPRLYPHLRRALRRTRCGTLCCDLGPAHEPRRRVCPWPHLPRLWFVRPRGGQVRLRYTNAPPCPRPDPARCGEPRTS